LQIFGVDGEMSFILALDAGTTSLKGALFDLSGKMLGVCVHEYHPDNPAPDIVELDAGGLLVRRQGGDRKASEGNIGVPPAAITALGRDQSGRDPDRA
jgi:glycerol kinase